MAGEKGADLEDAISPPLPPAAEGNRPLSRKRGGWRAILFIIGNESFERLASMGLIMNLSLYLKIKFNLYGVFLINVVSIWSGSCNLLPLLGAFIAEKYLDRFKTLLLGCTASFVGMSMMTLTAGIPQLKPAFCDPLQPQLVCQQPTAAQMSFLFVALGFLAVGAGCIRPCCVAFGADQFDGSTEEGRKSLHSFFNWWYLSFTATLILVLSVVVYIQTKVSWVLGLAIPAGCLALSVVVFLIGRRTYVIMKPQGSVYSDLAKVVVSSLRKSSARARHTPSDSNRPSFYDPPSPDDSDPQVTKLPHTERFRFFDKGCLINDPSELNAQGLPVNRWRLCSVQQVEQFKSLVSIAPVWVSGIACFLVMDQQTTNGIIQAIQSNQAVGKNFHIPPGWLGLTGMIVLSLWIFLYETVAPYISRKLRGKDLKGLKLHQRINLGIITSITTMVVAGIVETRRRDMALRAGSFVSPMSIGFLLPQFALSGLVEAFAAISVMELLTSYITENLRTVGGALFFLSMSIASYITSSLVSTVHAVTGTHGRMPWIGGRDLNSGRLDYYYYMIASLSAINLLYFNFFAKKFLSGTRI